MSNTVKLIVEKSTGDAIRPGTIINWAVEDTDFVAPDSEGEVKYLTVQGRVILGNKQYPTGKKLVIYMNFDQTRIEP